MEIEKNQNDPNTKMKFLSLIFSIGLLCSCAPKIKKVNYFQGYEAGKKAYLYQRFDINGLDYERGVSIGYLQERRMHRDGLRD